jgi:hypothetical protein
MQARLNGETDRVFALVSRVVGLRKNVVWPKARITYHTDGTYSCYVERYHHRLWHAVSSLSFDNDKTVSKTAK